jgi:hypothetical protein
VRLSSCSASLSADAGLRLPSASPRVPPAPPLHRAARPPRRGRSG